MSRYWRNAVPCMRNVCVPSLRGIQYESTVTTRIRIPKPIPRGPTDILKALSNTVRSDPTAAHYKYHDDPYLIPYSNFHKRSYALSQEAGRKAAQWIRQQHPELFQHKVAEPIIEAFVPKPSYNEESLVNEEVLKNSILNVCVQDSVIIYKLLKKKGIEVSIDTKQNLLELLCYYNGDDPLSEEWIEERWYRQGMKSRERMRNLWKRKGVAEELFEEFGGNSSQAVSAIISGMAKHGQIDGAWKLYEQAKSKDMMLSTTAYNCLLATIGSLFEKHELMYERVEQLLKEMNFKSVRVNLGTLNSVLATLSFMSKNRNALTYAFNVIAEFRTLGIQPSLGSFYYLMNMFYRDNSQLKGLIKSILDHLECTDIKIADPMDVMFFTRAMELTCHRLQDRNLGYRIDRLLHSGDNYNFIGDSYKESLYYRNFFILLCKTEPLDVFMEVYDRLVPNTYVPEPSVMNEILTAVEEQACWSLMPRLWSDIVMFEQIDNAATFEKVLSLAAKNSDDSLKEAMANIGWTLWEKIENSTRDRNPLEWSANLLGDVMIVLLEANELSKAHLIMEKMDRLQGSIIGEPNIKALLKYVDACIRENSVDSAIKCIRYSNDMGFLETEEMAKKLYSSTDLKTQQLERLVSIVGNDVLKLTENT